VSVSENFFYFHVTGVAHPITNTVFDGNQKRHHCQHTTLSIGLHLNISLDITL
jgi:hypothetical protein